MDIRKFIDTLPEEGCSAKTVKLNAVYFFRHSGSGKAVELELQSAGGIEVTVKWIPLSLLSRRDMGNFGGDLMVPMWFLYKNNLWNYAT